MAGIQTGRCPRWWALAAAPVALAGCLALAAPSAAADPAGGCPGPHLPVAVDGYPSLPVPEALPEVAAPLEVLPPGDADGDGRTDHVTERDGAVVVAVPGGEAVLTAGGDATVATPPSSPGDLDGDGLLEVVVSVGAGERTDTVVVPGDLAPGTHDPRQVGVVLAGLHLVAHAGDHDGDGADDVVISQPFGPEPSRRLLVSGRALMAAAPGGGAPAALGAPLASFDARHLGVADLGEAAPTLIAARPLPGGAAEVVVLTDPPVVLRTDRLPVRDDSGSLAAVNDAVGAFRSAAGNRIVVLRTSARSGSSSFAWDLDEPCAPPVRAGRTHVVAPGEWLWQIARSELRAHGLAAADHHVARYVERLVWVNHAAVGAHPDRIHPGTELFLPSP